jgi:hypothetical protein
MQLAAALRRRSLTSQPFLCGLGFCRRGRLSESIGLPHGLIFSPRPFGHGKDQHSNCQRSFSTSRHRVVDGRSLPGFLDDARPRGKIFPKPHLSAEKHRYSHGMRLRAEDQDQGETDLRISEKGKGGRNRGRRTLASRPQKEDRDTQKEENPLGLLLLFTPLLLQTVAARPDIDLVGTGLVGERGVVSYPSVLGRVYAQYLLAHALHEFGESYHFSSI